MIRVRFDPDELEGEKREWWDGWRERAERATRALKERDPEDGPPKFRQSIWAELKEWMFENVFARKCAYCEGKVTPQSYGDAEHWRPKKEVGRWDGDGAVEPVLHDGEPHPGYWWLAYEWTNLLPACERCNSGKGKGIQFPVENDYVFEPGAGESVDDLDRREGPLLLHPLRGADPADHIAFDEFGQPYPVDESPLGRASIRVFDLDRGILNEDRFACMENHEDKFKWALTAALAEERTFAETAGRLFDGSAEYSAAVKSHGDRWREMARDRYF